MQSAGLLRETGFTRDLWQFCTGGRTKTCRKSLSPTGIAQPRKNIGNLENRQVGAAKSAALFAISGSTRAGFGVTYWAAWLSTSTQEWSSRLEPPMKRPPAPERGLRCRQCGGGRFEVIYTRAALGNKIVRRRQCRICKARITTWERRLV